MYSPDIGIALRSTGELQSHEMAGLTFPIWHRAPFSDSGTFPFDRVIHRGRYAQSLWSILLTTAAAAAAILYVRSTTLSILHHSTDSYAIV